MIIAHRSHVDYPGRTSLVVACPGCNMRCWYCHNKHLWSGDWDVEESLNIIRGALRPIMSAITITGGEPTLYGGKLIWLLQDLRKLGLPIKLDTNGLNPETLMLILNDKLVDYVALDAKGSRRFYWEYAIDDKGLSKRAYSHALYSAELIKGSGIDYEIRTTVDDTLAYGDYQVASYLRLISGAKRLYLQNQRHMERNGRWIHARRTLNAVADHVSRYVHHCEIR